MAIIRIPGIILPPEKKIELLRPDQAKNNIVRLECVWNSEPIVIEAASAVAIQLATDFNLR